ncbi:hypothetical protein LSAT2_004743 [Lamellibrachia satsuma]|nr:hypothetical protein LSAT2_004743 [Lamellibrachia satsuma]
MHPGYTLSSRALKRIAKRYCGKRNNLSLDDFVYCVTKVSNTHENYRKMANQVPTSGAWGISLDEVLEMTL